MTDASWRTFRFMLLLHNDSQMILCTGLLECWAFIGWMVQNQVVNNCQWTIMVGRINCCAVSPKYLTQIAAGQHYLENQYIDWR